jgi:hypothetical protein
LHHAVADARNLKRTDFAISLWNIHPAVRLGFVPACYKVFPYGRKNGPSPLGLDVLKALTVDARGTPVSLGVTVSLFEGFNLRNVHEEPPEAM